MVSAQGIERFERRRWVYRIVVTAAFLAISSAADAAQLIGSFTVSYRFNAGGCSPFQPNPNGYGNPNYCIGLAPGPIHIPAPPGRYRVVRTQVLNPADDAGGVKVWDGNADQGIQYNPGAGPVEFDHSFGDITVYYHDWFTFDNDPSIGSVVELYALDCTVPSAEEFQFPTTGTGSVNPPVSGWVTILNSAGVFLTGYSFAERLLGGDFTGRMVNEFDASSPTSTCTGVPPSPVTGNKWTIQSDGLFADAIGLGKQLIFDIQAGLPQNGSCSFVNQQQMKMYCPATNTYMEYGGINRIEITVYKTRVSFSRAGVGATKRCTAASCP